MQPQRPVRSTLVARTLSRRLLRVRMMGRQEEFSRFSCSHSLFSALFLFPFTGKVKEFDIVLATPQMAKVVKVAARFLRQNTPTANKGEP